MQVDNILETIGHTPMVKINKLFPGHHEIWMKMEMQNPGGSIKDRIALNMVKSAVKRGELKTGGTIVEPTSGNTGVGLAMVAAVLNYRIILVMPDTMSGERCRLFKAYGATFELTPGEKGMQGAIDKAHELVSQIPGAWMPCQFENDDNPAIHRETTAKEILSDFPGGFDYLFAGVGSAGHITGVGEVLKGRFPELKVVAVEPYSSSVLSGRNPGKHKIQGIGAGFVPRNLNESIIDEIVRIEDEEAFAFTRELALREGICAGISTGATLAAVNKIVEVQKKPLKIVTFGYDNGLRYLSEKELF